MRQAGRSLPEYHAIRGTGSILDAVADPDKATAITLQPVDRYGVDAAILFSDIIVPVHALGFGIDISPGIGPTVDQPFNNSADLERLRPFEPDIDAPYVAETIRQVVSNCSIPVIGFAGAPFTVASYLIEGKPSRDLKRTRSLIEDDPNLFNSLMEKLADIAISSLLSQIEAGVSAIQLFDTWAGSLDSVTYKNQILPHSKRIFSAIGKTQIPRIHFGTKTSHILNLLADAGSEVIGIDWITPLDKARQLLGPNAILQGNLDPKICLEPPEIVDKATYDVLKQNGNHPGHIFNLGHGVLPDTDPGVLAHIVEIVHDYKPS